MNRSSYVSAALLGLFAIGLHGTLAAPLPKETTAIVRVKLTTEAKPGEFIRAMEQHNDKKVCCAGPESHRRDQTWIVGEKGEVANAIVSLELARGKKAE